MSPTKPARPCRKPGCPLLTNAATGYCEAHGKQAQRQADAHRGSSSERGYTSRWRRIRAIVLAEEPLCRKCSESDRVTAATDVDHIDGNVNNMDRSNLQPLCHECHSRKTASENGAFGNRG